MQINRKDSNAQTGVRRCYARRHPDKLMEPECPYLRVTGVVSSLPGEAVCEPFRFTGTGGEYFRIWIVNVMLSVVTFGIYSAWAKARRLQYALSPHPDIRCKLRLSRQPARDSERTHTGVLSVRRLLRGQRHQPRGRRRGVCVARRPAPVSFSHDRCVSGCTTAATEVCGSISMDVLAEAYRVFLAMPALAIVSLFTLVPLAHHRLKRFQHANAAYGQTRFAFDARRGFLQELPDHRRVPVPDTF